MLFSSLDIPPERETYATLQENDFSFQCIKFKRYIHTYVYQRKVKIWSSFKIFLKVKFTLQVNKYVNIDMLETIERKTICTSVELN